MRHAGLLVCGIILSGFFVSRPVTSSAAELDHLLFQTIRRGNTKVLATLLRQGTPVQLRSPDGTTPLMFAALRGDVESVKLLLDHGADPNAANNIGATSLLWGAGDLEKVRLLLNAGANPNGRSKLGNTPLIVAAAYADSSRAVKLLLEKGAELKAKNNRGNTALRSAVTAGDRETVKLLLARGIPLKTGKDGSADLSIAAGRGFSKIVQLLLDQGADPNASGGRSALNAALLAQKPEIARMLIDNGARLDQRLRPGEVPSIVLSAYTEVGDSSIARLMIAKNADLNATNADDETVLTWARKRGHAGLINLLVEAGGTKKSNSKTRDIPKREIVFNAASRQQLLKKSIKKSISLLQHSSDVFLKNRESCVSCHHQNLPAIAIGWARDRGFQVNDDSNQRMIDGQLKSWRPRIDRAYQMDRPVPVAPRFIGYGLLGFAALGYPQDEVTDAMVWYLANLQQPDGHWVPGMLRPPLGGAEIGATVLAMRSLQLYPLEGRDNETAKQVERAKHWLQTATPRIHQDRVFRLLGLGWAGVSQAELGDDVTELLNEQRADGGWAQLPGLKSDAWATGQTLVALYTAGGLSTTHPSYHRGIEFLLRTQFDDGSWFVGHRTWPFQTQFDSEFPYDRDQWISAPATAWAVMALTLAVEPSGNVVVAHRNTPGRSSAKTRKPPAAGETKPSASPAKAPVKSVDVKSVDFSKQIKPLFERSCLGCHGGSDPKSGFRVTTRVFLLKGGESGEAAVVPGRGQDSPLIRFVSGEVEDLEMPPLAKRNKYPALTKSQIDRLQAWIRQGATWPKGVVLKARD